MKTTLILLLLTFTSTASWATVTSIGKGKIPYSPVQEAIYDYDYLAENWNQEDYYNTQAFCMTDFMYYDNYSSSSLPTFDFMMDPKYIPSFPKDGSDEQINELSDGKLQVNTDWESYDNYTEINSSSNNLIHEPAFVVDVSAYDKSTPAGRLESLVKAKLAVISIHYNLLQHGTPFRATIDIVGLPEDQSEFVNESFSKVLSVTEWPYTASSPLAKRFYDELLTTYTCSDVRDEVL